MPVARKSVPGQDVTVASWRHLNTKLGDAQVYPFIVRLTILTYRTQPRFRSAASAPSPSEPATRTHSRHGSSFSSFSTQDLFSSGDHGTSATTSAAPKFNSKLPKELPKLLQARLNKIALKTDSRMNDDPLLRRSFLSFYALALSPEFMRQVKENRRAEDLVMMFLSCVAKELNKSAVSQQEARGLVDKQAAAFVRMLIDTITENNLASSCQSLIKQLESYESSLRSSSKLALQPTSTNSSSYYSAESVATPTFKLNDMLLAQDIASLFLVANSELQRDVDDTKNEATEKRVVAELKKMERDLNDYNLSTAYKSIDFASSSEWEDFKAKELETLAQQISHYSSGGKYSSADTAEDAYFVPSDPRSYFRHLLKRCLERDFRNAGRELETNPDSSPLLLAKPSLNLLHEAASLWHIPAVTRALILIDVAQEMFNEGVFTLDHMNDAFNLAKYLVVDQAKKQWVPEMWPQPDKVYFATILSSIHDTIVSRIGELLSRIYDNSPPKIGPYLQTLEEHVYVDAHTKGFQPIEPSRKQIEKLEEVILSAAELKYDALIDDIPRDHTLDPLHIIDLADKLVAIAKKLQKRYKFPLFEELSIAHISTKRHLTLFSADAHSMFNYMMSHMNSRNEEPSFEDMIVLYKKLAEIRDLFVQVSDESFDFDIEAVFYPYVVKWADSSAALALSWVDPAVESDDFQPVNEENGQMNSSSVTDIFKSFRSALSVVSDLDWRNEVHRAKILTILMKGISGALCKYSELLTNRFIDELKVQDEDQGQIRTRQDKIMATLRNVVDTRMKAPPPYRFLKETCVKLNNIELAQTELDKIERELDSEHLSGIISKVEKTAKRPTNFLFTIKIMRAEDLKACDSYGLSDPYVTLMDQQTRRTIGKTRVIFADLNPVWDEVFEVVTSGPKLITATVWDENAVTNHEICGRSFIRLDPKAFQDFISQDYWLDLDTQGRVLVNVSMESERDDIRFHFGKAFRTLLRTETDMTRLIVDKFSTFIKYFISTNTLKSLQRSGINLESVSSWLSSTKLRSVGTTRPAQRLSQAEIEDSLNPLFDYLNENFSTLAHGLTHEMRIKVMTQTWKVVLNTIELLLLPALNDKRTTQTQLTAAEADIVFTWLSALRDFFHHDGAGPSLEVLQSQKYQELMTIPVYYDLSTAELKQESEKMSSLSFKSLQERNYLMIPEMIKRKNTVMAHRNKRAFDKQREQIRMAKRESPQTEDIILRILRARGEINYVSRRLKQRERISQTLATESIVRNAAGGFRRSGYDEY